MSRTLLIASVCFAAYALLDLTVSAFVALMWRTRAVAPSDLPPATRARRLFLLRVTPAMTSALVTLAVVVPAFAIFEPAGHEESIGPALAALAAAGLIQIGASIISAARSVWLTARFERRWLRASAAIDAGIAGDLQAFAIESPAPIVALVGVFAPKLIAARSVVEACTSDEIAQIVAHERGHFDARDNLKRWLMASLPDALRWTPIHRDIVDAWHHAAEDAADDAATNGDAPARADLAALLLKIVRMAPGPSWDTAIVSPFVEDHGLERRVKRLLRPELEPPAPWAIVPMALAGTMVIAIIATMSSLEALEATFEAFERLVALGR
jgi:Zn-dependent protease with chaperone function